MSTPSSTGMDLGWLWDTLEERRREGDPDSSYTARLLDSGPDRIAQKVGEEATETIIAGLRMRLDGGAEELVGEAADLVYHLMVFLLVNDLTLADVVDELQRRHRDP